MCWRNTEGSSCWRQALFFANDFFHRLAKNVCRFQVYWTVSSFFKKKHRGNYIAAILLIFLFLLFGTTWDSVTGEISVLGVVLVSEWHGSVQRDKNDFQCWWDTKPCKSPIYNFGCFCKVIVFSVCKGYCRRVLVPFKFSIYLKCDKVCI